VARVTLIHTARSKTPIAAEYDFVSKAMLRCERHVHTFDASKYSESVLAKARDLWLFRMGAEHRSASVFAALCNQLMAAGATVDMIGIVLRMAQDEIRHAEICAEVVTALGGNAIREVPDPISPIATHPGCTPEDSFGTSPGSSSRTRRSMRSSASTI
jgi:hypothetical protein